MSVQTEITRGRIARIATTINNAAPTDGNAGTQPTFILGPRTSTGLKTTGLGIGLKAPSAGAATTGAGFGIVLYVLNPYTWAWFSGAQTTIDFGQLFVTYDMNAAGIYVQVASGVSADGDIDVHFWEA